MIDRVTRFIRAMRTLKGSTAGNPRSGGKKTKPPYRPGTLGVSAVSQDIRRDYGRIVSRRERRRLAREGGPAFRPYYNWR